MSSAESGYAPPGLGKIILLGEHAVVYGHQALAGAIDRGVRCRIERCEGASALTIPAWQIDVRASDPHPVARAFTALVDAAKCSGVHVHAQSDLPASAGLGSSAALSVALARALRPALSDFDLLALANVGEAHFHERPSGIDVALSARGGIGSYRVETGLTPLDAAPLPLVVGLSGLARSTATMVAGVRARRESDPQTRTLLQRIGSMAEEGTAALQAGEHSRLGALMNQCHELLAAIGVSVDVLDKMVHIARDAGATGAKLTGAGGGGAMIALAPGGEEQVQEALQAAGYESFITRLGATP